MNCPHQIWRPGIKTYSHSVPDIMNGEYFPGDEPHYHCAICNGECGDPENDDPNMCAPVEYTAWICPECYADGERVPLYRNGRGNVLCENGHAFGNITEAPEYDEDFVA